MGAEALRARLKEAESQVASRVEEAVAAAKEEWEQTHSEMARQSMTLATQAAVQKNELDSLCVPGVCWRWRWNTTWRLPCAVVLTRCGSVLAGEASYDRRRVSRVACGQTCSAPQRRSKTPRTVEMPLVCVALPSPCPPPVCLR